MAKGKAENALCQGFAKMEMKHHPDVKQADKAKKLYSGVSILKISLKIKTICDKSIS